VTCPRGQQATTWVPSQDDRGGAIIQAKFRRADCRSCPSRPECNRSATQPCAVMFRRQAQQRALQAARQRQTTIEFKAQYTACAGVEGTLSRGVRGFGLRRTRYRGLAKTHLQHILTVVAMHLVRVIAWFEGGCPRHALRPALSTALKARPRGAQAHGIAGYGRLLAAGCACPLGDLLWPPCQPLCKTVTGTRLSQTCGLVQGIVIQLADFKSRQSLPVPAVV